MFCQHHAVHFSDLDRPHPPDFLPQLFVDGPLLESSHATGRDPGGPYHYLITLFGGLHRRHLAGREA